MRYLLKCAMSGIAILTLTSTHADIQTGIDAYNNQDYATAFNEFEHLAKAGDAGAQLQLGLMYDNGLGKTKDHDKAFYWYQQSATNGNPHAQFNVAEMMMLGQGTHKDSTQALQWYRRAAEAGFPEAQYKLGQILSDKSYSERDLIEAYKWLVLAGNQPVPGAEAAISLFEKLAIEMTPDEIAEARKRVERWQKRFSEKQPKEMFKI